MATRANNVLTVLASASRTATNTAPNQVNDWCRGGHIILDVSSLQAGTPSITLTIKGIDPVSGNKYTILLSAAVVTVSTNVYKVYPGCIAAANLVANDFMPLNWTVTVTHTDTQPITYSVGAFLNR